MYPTTYVRAATPPSGGPTPGAKALMAAVLNAFPGATNLGIYNPRDVCGNAWPNFKCAPSQHATGRACDFGIPVPSRPRLGDAIAAALVRQARSLGITEVIWSRRRWSATAGWQPYSGRSPHLDHVHTTLHPDAAARLSAAEARAALDTQTQSAENQEDFMATMSEDEKARLLAAVAKIEAMETQDRDAAARVEATVGNDVLPRLRVIEEQLGVVSDQLRALAGP